MLKNFYTMLAVCHTVMVDEKENGELTYQASSPDEEALVKGAGQLGYVLKDRKTKSDGTVDVHFHSEEEGELIFKVYFEFPFDSTRKRMSVVCEHQGKYYLMCKGADSIMFPRCRYEGI